MCDALLTASSAHCGQQVVMSEPGRTFLSKAWSGGSMIAGTEAMSSRIKQELPDSIEALEQKVKDPMCEACVLAPSKSPHGQISRTFDGN